MPSGASCGASRFAPAYIDGGRQFKVHNQQHLKWTRDIGDRAGMAHALFYSASWAESQGNLSEAARLYQETAVICREIGDRKSLGFAIMPQAFNHLFRGQWARAREAQSK